MSCDPLVGLAADPGLARFWADAHERWCENGRCAGEIAIRPAEATAVRRLLGLRNLSTSTVTLKRIAQGLRGEEGLAAVLIEAVGPLENRRAARQGVRDARIAQRAARLAAWRDAAAGMGAVLDLEAADQSAGLPDLPPRLAPVLTAASEHGRLPTWRTFSEAGVRESSAAHRLALRLVEAAHPTEDPATRLALCRHPAEVAARNFRAPEPVIDFCRDHGGRAPLKVLRPNALDCVVRLLIALQLDAFVRDRPLLAVLARERFDDPHALDRTAPAGQAAIRFVAARLQIAPPTSADRWRDAWRRAGVEPDRVSSRVLVCGLRPTGREHPLSELLAAGATRGDELSLGLRQLSDGLPPLDCRRVLVVENPPVFESLMSDLPDGNGLACCEGVPTAAARHLVRALVSAGIHVGVSADDDRGGVTVKAVLAAEGAQILAPFSRWEEASIAHLRSWLIDIPEPDPFS